VNEANHWQRCLLRARRERPRSDHAAEKRDELAPLHVPPEDHAFQNA
jgi:hypothetical protein